MEAIRKIIDKSSAELTIVLPEAYQNKKLEVIILAADEEATDAPQQTTTPKKYDFSDFFGKLKWEGDALAEQRKLRDEWE